MNKNHFIHRRHKWNEVNNLRSDASAAHSIAHKNEQRTMNELFYKVLERMNYVDGQNNYEVNCINLTYFDGQMYAESVCVNDYGTHWSNEDHQEIDLDERELYEVLDLMHGSNFVRIFEPEYI